ncbi:MAG: mandelate racemase/muconate lactonizing enzyme family protein [Chloroflexi bacterium]|nr:mandelate racemase/muconate lactonizing enzyme family protein [Chloroflexota bacterium]
MKITDVEVIVLEQPQAYAAPKGSEESAGVKFLCLVRVSTDEGITGYADVETQPHVAKAAAEAPYSGSDAFEGLRNLAIGEDPFETEKLWDKMYRGSIYYGRRGVAIQVMSGIDIACWDIKGKATGLPVYKLLGAGYRDKVRAYASTLFRPTPDDMRRAVDYYLERGFTAIKFGWGVFGQDPKLDVQLVKAAREQAGPDVEVLVDAGWKVHRTPFEAVEMVRSIEEFEPYWVEDFMHPEDYAGYAYVSDRVETRVAAGEQEATIWGFERLIDEGKVDVAQPDISRCGGLTVAKKIADYAELRNRSVCPHAWLSDILTSASLHVNAYLKKSLFLEYNVSSGPLARDLCANPIELKDGYIDVPQGPGLGVEIDPAAIAKYRVA